MTSAPEKTPLAGVHDEIIYHVLNEMRGQSWFDKCNALEASLVKAGWRPPAGHPLAVADELAAKERRVGETGWLIEAWSSRAGEFKAKWYAGGAVGWTTDSIQALRFGRERDAQQYIDEIGWTEAKPTEHSWNMARAALEDQR